MIDCNIIENIEKASVINGCDPIDERLIRLQTVFMYPEGSYIDVFLRMHDSPTAGYYLTDMGQTFSYLADLHISIYESQKNKNLAEQIYNLLNIHEKNEELFTPVREDFSDAGDAILRLSQACIRIADLYYTKRFRQSSYRKGSTEEIFVTGDSDGNQLLEAMNIVLDKLTSEISKFETDEGLRKLLKKMIKRGESEEGIAEEASKGDSLSIHDNVYNIFDYKDKGAFYDIGPPMTYAQMKIPACRVGGFRFFTQ